MYIPRQKNDVMKKTLTLQIVTPDGIALEHVCTSLRLPIQDTADGHGGGFYGVHPGHLSALFALTENKRITVVPADESKKPFQITVCGGIAAVTQNVVTILTDNCTVEGVHTHSENI